MKLEDASYKRELIHQEHNYFSVLLSEYDEPHNDKKCGITKIQKNMKSGILSS